MRINSINFNPTTGVVKIGYSRREHDGKDKVTSECVSSDAPHPDLVSSLADLQEVIESICELPDGFMDIVRGFHLKRSSDDEDEFTVVFTATKTISAAKGPVVVNTPLYLPDEDERKRIIECLKEARAYIEGKRAQGDFTGDAKPKKKGKGSGKKKSKEKQQELIDQGEGETREVEEPGDDIPEGLEEPVDSRPTFPKGQDGQVYQAKSSLGNTCTVKQQAGGWYGRISGRAIASKQPMAEAAMRKVNEYAKEDLAWAPTVDLPDSAGVEEPEDLTGGI